MVSASTRCIIKQQFVRNLYEPAAEITARKVTPPTRVSSHHSRKPFTFQCYWNLNVKHACVDYGLEESPRPISAHSHSHPDPSLSVLRFKFSQTSLPPLSVTSVVQPTHSSHTPSWRRHQDPTEFLLIRWFSSLQTLPGDGQGGVGAGLSYIGSKLVRVHGCVRRSRDRGIQSDSKACGVARCVVG